jgi:hypothetical protein
MSLSCFMGQLQSAAAPVELIEVLMKLLDLGIRVMYHASGIGQGHLGAAGDRARERGQTAGSNKNVMPCP